MAFLNGIFMFVIKFSSGEATAWMPRTRKTQDSGRVENVRTTIL